MLADKIEPDMVVVHSVYGVGIVNVVCNTPSGVVCDVQFERDGGPLFVEFSEGIGEEIFELEPLECFGGQDKLSDYKRNNVEERSELSYCRSKNVKLTVDDIVTVLSCLYDVINRKKDKIEDYSSLGLDDERTRAYIAELESDVQSIDYVIKKFN